MGTTTINMDAALRLVCKDPSPYFPNWMDAPFHTGVWNAATDTHIMVGYKGEAEYPALEKGSVATRVNEYLSGTYGPLQESKGALRAYDMIEAFDNWPRVSEVDCLSCLNGTGDANEICTVCGGSGELRVSEGEEKFRDLHAQVLVAGIGHFKTFTWAKLGPLLKAIEADELLITHGGPLTMMRLEVLGTNIVIGVMPVRQEINGPSLDHEPFRVFSPYTT